MNWSAGGSLALPKALTVALTSIVPALCAGETALQLVCEEHSTPLARTPPNLNLVAPAPSAKPLPVIVTLVPPAAGPEVGLSWAIVGLVNL